MKVIDLLNIWVKDRNKLPEKIKIDNKVFEYDEGCNLYKTPDEDCYLIQNYLNCVERLDGEVEAIEENKEIKELDEMQIINARPELNAIKINELVQAVNKINKQLEEQETEDIEIAERELNKIFKERGESKDDKENNIPKNRKSEDKQ